MTQSSTKSSKLNSNSDRYEYSKSYEYNGINVDVDIFNDTINNEKSYECILMATYNDCIYSNTFTIDDMEVNNIVDSFENTNEFSILCSIDENKFWIQLCHAGIVMNNSKYE